MPPQSRWQRAFKVIAAGPEFEQQRAKVAAAVTRIIVAAKR